METRSGVWRSGDKADELPGYGNPKPAEHKRLRGSRKFFH